jgi:hypothetical protein
VLVIPAVIGGCLFLFCKVLIVHNFVVQIFAQSVGAAIMRAGQEPTRRSSQGVHHCREVQKGSAKRKRKKEVQKGSARKTKPSIKRGASTSHDDITFSGSAFG